MGDGSLISAARCEPHHYSDAPRALREACGAADIAVASMPRTTEAEKRVALRAAEENCENTYHDGAAKRCTYVPHVMGAREGGCTFFFQQFGFHCVLVRISNKI